MKLVNYVKELVMKYGLKKTLMELKSNKESYTTQKGEYIWIHSKTIC